MGFKLLELFTNHFLTGREEANNIDCISDNQPYNDVVYKLNTDPDVIEQLQRQYSSWYFSDIESYGSITDLVGLRSHVLVHGFKHVETDSVGSLLAKMICFVILKDFVTEMVEHKSIVTQDLVLHVLQGRSSGGLLRYHPNAYTYNAMLRLQCVPVLNFTQYIRDAIILDEI